MRFGMARATTKVWSVSALAAILFTIALAFSIADRRGLDPIIDVGRDYYYGEAVANGATPYVDFRYNYPPIALYTLAVWTKCAGASLHSFALLGVLIAAATAVAIYFLGLEVGGPLVGFLAAELFAALSVAGRTNSNYLYPYSYAATLGAFFLAAFLVYVSRAIRCRFDSLDSTIAIAFAALAAWTKIEYAGAVVAVAVVVSLRERVPRRILLATGVAAIASFVAAHVVFSRGSAPLTWMQNVFPTTLFHGEGAVFFHRSAAGFDRWRENLSELAIGAALYVAVAFLARSVSRRSAAMGWAVALLALLAGAGIASDFWLRGFIVLLVFEFVRRIRRRDESPLLFVLLAASLVCAARIPLNLVPRSYGFVLLVPIYCCAAALLLERGGLWSGDSRTTRTIWALLLMGIAVRSLMDTRTYYSDAIHLVATRRGAFFERNRERAAVFNQFLAWQQAAPNGSMTVIPEGIAFNYFAQRKQPLYFYMFTPAEVGDRAVEQRVLEDLRRNRPRYIVRLPRSESEYGGLRWGLDYARDLDRAFRDGPTAIEFRNGSFWMSVTERADVRQR